MFSYDSTYSLNFNSFIAICVCADVTISYKTGVGKTILNHFRLLRYMVYCLISILVCIASQHSLMINVLSIKAVSDYKIKKEFENLLVLYMVSRLATCKIQHLVPYLDDSCR